RGRNDVGGVPGKKKTAVLHGLDDKTVHLGDVLLQDRPFNQFPTFLRGESSLELLPNSFVGPKPQILIRGALDIKAADLRRAHAEQSETALVISVDQLLRRRRRLRENAQPSEGIIALENRERARGNGGTADAMETVAAGNEIAGQLGFLSFMQEKNPGPRRVKIVDADFFGFKEKRAAESEPCIHEVFDDFALGIDRDGAAGQVREIDAMGAPAEAQINAVMHEPFALHSLAHAHFSEQVGGVLFEEAGADALLTILAAVQFEHNGSNSPLMQQMAEHKARRAGADDANLGAHPIHTR